KCVYCTKPAQLPLAQGTCLIHAAASTSVVNSRQIRSGVQNSARPVTACRPQGPPTASLAWATTGSTQLGTTRSGHGGAARRRGGTLGDATDPPGALPEGSVVVFREGGGCTDASLPRPQAAPADQPVPPV